MRYFYDFCEKHHISGDEAHRIRAFLDKLREKKQSEGQLRRAYNAVKLYFEMLKEIQAPTEAITPPRALETDASEVIQAVDTQQPATIMHRSFYSETGQRRRWHLHESELQEALYPAVRKAKIPKRVTSHTFRHSFATHLLQAGYDIRLFRQCWVIQV